MTTGRARGFGIAAIAALALGASAARADDVSPSALALAKTVLSDVGLTGSLDTIVPAMLGQMEQNLVRVHPEMRASIHEVIKAAQPDFAKTEESVVADVAHTLATQLSEQELKETQAYFESAAGRKYVASQAPVLQELGVSGGVWRQKLAIDMYDRVKADLKKKGLDF